MPVSNVFAFLNKYFCFVGKRSTQEPVSLKQVVNFDQIDQVIYFVKDEGKSFSKKWTFLLF